MRLTGSTLLSTGLRGLLGLAAVAGVLATAAPANAQLLGSQVTGSLNFNGGANNFFDPANGFVPGGFLNTAGPTVTIAEPAVEFGFDDGANLDTANFTATQLIIRDVVNGAGASPWSMTFISTAFLGATLVEDSDSFPTGGATASLVGDTITVNWAGLPEGAADFSAVYNIRFAGGAAAPEPGSLALLGAGLGMAGLVARRRGR